MPQTIDVVIEEIKSSFEAYKKTNDERLNAIKQGKSTEDFQAKLGAIEKDMQDLGNLKSQMEQMELRMSRPGALTSAAPHDGETPEEAEYRTAFMDWVRAPGNPEQQQRCATAAKTLQTKRSDGREHRAAQVMTSTGPAGGFALPEVIERQISRLGMDISPMRQLATVRAVGTTDYKELFDVGGSSFAWSGEGDTRAKTNTNDLAEVTPKFGMAHAYPMASEESLEDLFFDVENWLVTSASDALANGEGDAFINGTGVKMPQGLLAGPVPTNARDDTRPFGTVQYIASGAIPAPDFAAGSIVSKPDVFFDIVYALRARYRRNAVWLTNKLSVAAIRKYKDTTGQYLWQPSMTKGQPDTFLGYPIVEDEKMPTVINNNFPLAFGDIREAYLIADRVGMRITRDEITAPGFVKFFVRRRVGGTLRNTQAVKLLKIAAT